MKWRGPVFKGRETYISHLLNCLINLLLRDDAINSRGNSSADQAGPVCLLCLAIHIILSRLQLSFHRAVENIYTHHHSKHCNMPGRVSARASSASLSHNASSQRLGSRRTTALSTIDIPDEGPSTALRTRICEIFSLAQKSTAGHRKLATSLRKIQEECCYELPKTQRQGQAEFGEDDFNVEVARCVIRLMCLKKSEAVGDRVVKFLGLFLQRASAKGELINNRERSSF